MPHHVTAPERGRRTTRMLSTGLLIATLIAAPFSAGTAAFADDAPTPPAAGDNPTPTPSDFAVEGTAGISGDPVVPATVGAIEPVFTPQPDSITYAWSVDENVQSSADSALHLTPSMASHLLTVTVTAHKDGYTDLSSTSPPVTVRLTDLAANTIPRISGSPVVGHTLTAVTGTFTPEPMSIGYRWLRGSMTITGASKKTYKTTAKDIGKPISVRVVATSPDYGTYDARSKATSAVQGVFTTKAPTITGTRQVGKTLTAHFPVWTPTPSTKAYRWYRNGSPIASATHSTYKLTPSDYGKSIIVKVAGHRTDYVASTRTLAAGAIAKAAGAILRSAPVLSGTARSGATLTVSRGSWSISGLNYHYSWYRSGVAIKGATRQTYKLNGADVGKFVSAHVTVSKTGFRDTAATSKATGAVAKPKPAFSGNGVYRVGAQIPAGTYYTGATSYCYWARLTSSSDSSTENIIANDIGSGQRMMTVKSTDKYVKLSDCGSWYPMASAGPSKSSIASNGVFRVGLQVKPGTYTAHFSDGCYWARLSTADGNLDSILDNDFISGKGSTTITVKSTDYGVQSSDCGSWTRIK